MKAYTVAKPHAPQTQTRYPFELPGSTAERSARASSNANTAYSDTCPPFRITKRTRPSASALIPGTNHRRNGPRYREVWFADNASVDPQKINVIQRTTGPQYPP